MVVEIVKKLESPKCVLNVIATLIVRQTSTNCCEVLLSYENKKQLEGDCRVFRTRLSPCKMLITVQVCALYQSLIPWDYVAVL